MGQSRHFCALILLAMVHISARAQDSAYARAVVRELSSQKYWGRGYTNGGMEKAAAFIATEMKGMGLQPMQGGSFFQKFSYPVVTFPGAMELELNGRQLAAGRDFIVSPDCAAIHAGGNLEKADSITWINREKKFVVQVVPKLTWSVSAEAAPYSLVQIGTGAIGGDPKKFKARIENNVLPGFVANNVCAFVTGTVRPDSFLFITAHYDHLGGMGKDVYFPGANDNASGVALMLSMARYFSAHPQKYSIGFVAFAGEEAGLKGSKYFTENPLVPLKNIRFLINLDLEGSGSDGITVVNATEFPGEFEWMQAINARENLLAHINSRGKAANSDHYFFSEAGVPAFFFYTLGGSPAYHDVNDVETGLGLEKINSLERLIEGFFAALQ